MKICLICNEYPPRRHGGLGTFVRTYAHGIKSAGHQVTVVGVGGVAEEHDDDGVRVVQVKHVRCRGISWILQRLALKRFLNREVREKRIEIIEVPDFQGMLPFRFNACPVVVRLHMSATAIARKAGHKIHRGVEWCESKTLHLHRNWIAVSENVLRMTSSLFKIHPQKKVVVYNAMSIEDSKEDEPFDLPEEFILFAGSLSVFKGVIEVAKAAAKVLKQFPALHLVYVGEATKENGRLVDEMICECIGGELRHRCHFTGRISREKLHAYMRRAKLFVFPSKLEACPMVIGEAILAGCPVVTSNIPPFTEYLEDQITGMLVDPDSPNEISQAMQRILQDEKFAKRLSRRAKEVNEERFSLERVVKDSLTFYKECLQTNEERESVP